MSVRPGSKTEEIEIFSTDGGFRWRYVNRPEERVLLSNDEFDDAGSARRAARTAYPRVPVTHGSVPEERVTRTNLLVLAVLAVTVVGLLVVLLREA